jgi:hypothetical protein
VAIDLYKEYAHKRKNADTPDYFDSIKNALLSPLEPLLPSSEYRSLGELIDKEILNPIAFQGMQPKTEVAAGFVPQQKEHAFAVQNRETSRVQAKQQERISDKQEAKKQENIEQRLQEYLNQVESRRGEGGFAGEDKEFPKKLFFSKAFAVPEEAIDLNSEQPCCWTLDSALNEKKTPSKHECRFEEGILTTNNAAVARFGALDLLGPYRKKPWPILVLCDEQPGGTKTWKAMLCSIADGMQFQEFLAHEKEPGVPGRQFWLVRANGKPCVDQPPLDIDSDPKLARMMTQLLLFTGDFETLSYAPWKARVQNWLQSLPPEEKQAWIHFFEQEVLIGTPPAYEASPLYRYFHTQ